MKATKLVVVITMVLALTLAIKALPQQTPSQPTQQKLDDNKIEEAHGALFQAQDKAKDASKLTEAVAATLPPPGPEAYAPIAKKNFVDEFVLGRMERDKIPHAPLAGDSEFLRRAYLDATGLLPTPDQVRAFLADKDPNKRDKLIDSLIGTDAFADQWSYHYGELNREDDARFHLYTKAWLKADRPYNDVFYDIVTASTKYLGGQPAGMYFDPTTYTNTRCIFVTDSDSLKSFNRLDWADEVTSEIGRVFLGVTMECFSCHNGAGHADTVNLFLASEKRSDFWQQAAFFGTTRLTAAQGFQNGSPSVDDLAPGYNTKDDGQYFTPAESRFPRDGRIYEPAFFLTGEKPKPGENPRKALGRILPTHIQFARAAVNIVWQKLMVVGLVEPYDGFDLKRLDPKNPPPAPWTIQPSNPELLEALAQDFRANNYSIQHVIKTIMKSNAYQLSTVFDGQWKDQYISYHARRFARILTGPEAVDLVAEATDAPFPVREYGQSYKYVKELTNPAKMRTDPNPLNKEVFAFMQAYYQSERALPPADKSMANAVQAMMMMSSGVVTNRVGTEGSTRVASLLKAGKSDDQIIEELVLASLSRFPTAGEVEFAKHLIAEKGKSEGLQTMQWVVLNTPEFLLNH